MVIERIIEKYSRIVRPIHTTQSLLIFLMSQLKGKYTSICDINRICAIRICDMNRISDMNRICDMNHICDMNNTKSHMHYNAYAFLKI